MVSTQNMDCSVLATAATISSRSTFFMEKMFLTPVRSSFLRKNGISSTVAIKYRQNTMASVCAPMASE